MRTAPLPAWRIVSGKFQASLIPLLLLIIGTAPALVILLAFQRAMMPNILRILQVVGMTGLFVTVLGMFFSSVCSRTSTATVWTYGVVSAMSLLTMLALLGGGVFGPRFIETVFVVNPIAAVMDAAGHQATQDYNLLRPYLQIMAAASGILFVLTVARVYQLGKAD
jgi:ABC-type transport system involved in multi-copper enzyme maturation permease subunit